MGADPPRRRRVALKAIQLWIGLQPPFGAAVLAVLAVLAAWAIDVPVPVPAQVASVSQHAQHFRARLPELTPGPWDKPNMPAKSAASARASFIICLRYKPRTSRYTPRNQAIAPVAARVGGGGEAAASLASCDGGDVRPLSRLGSKGIPSRNASAWRRASRTWISTPTTSRRARSVSVLAPACCCCCCCAAEPDSLLSSAAVTASSTAAWRTSTGSAASSMCDMIVLRL
ncbi:hypothetical protein Vafri_3344 [Volvox africanus]|uniref:Uncharacterized protein n=1 Tax=Volvox africanus TaxID=51714 RepID=A0A8J4ARB0_9CHLO|nr:hypothetical protein Vafri_3344 [Volvox africanus]